MRTIIEERNITTLQAPRMVHTDTPSFSKKFVPVGEAERFTNAQGPIA
jgi:hypothetical protein